ncbi:SDR family oxidoreductase [Acidobacterium sp. S8]|uniref:SDR family NAD(P)-dependent oxidoreductase n=1 Tax=Acidobacterium sp. S8 TaxID=1641854 RepID=UPI00131D4B2D|nr:SDR family NAD(P)-dependent oxidoreductase [Acidobacterium sp. S8]
MVTLSRMMRRRKAKSLLDKVVLITGSSRGLGLAMAEEFGRRGAKLVLTARDEKELERSRQLLLERRVIPASYVLVVPADLRKAEEAEYLIQRATEHFGQIDILINNAGVITVGPVENQTVQNFHDVMDANFFSGLHCSLAALPQMLGRRSGIIVNITSIGGKVAVPHMLPYTASKFAAVGFSEGLHAELRAKGIHVLTVCPGLMRTGSHLNALFSGDAPREYRWFSLAATLPIVSTSASHAARKIARAVISETTEIAITPQAILAARLSNLAPEFAAQAMSSVNRLLLPQSVSQSTGLRRGAEVRDQEWMPASKIGLKAGSRYNQTG